MASTKVYEIVTERILAELEKGEVPWRRTWTGGGRAKNLVSKKAYRGINTILLGLAPFSSPYWLTFNQAKKLGGTVEKDQRKKGSVVVFWKLWDKPGQDKTPDDEKEQIPVLRYYRVFNTDQCELPDGVVPAVTATSREHTPAETAETIIQTMPLAPRIQHGGSRAYYSPILDYVQSPKPEDFESGPAYYHTLFHELTHATGHHSRLDRFKKDEPLAAFGSADYGKEELVAEIGASFLVNSAGLDVDYQNSAAYVNNWLSVLRKDPKMVVFAAAQAQKAADFIQGKGN